MRSAPGSRLADPQQIIADLRRERDEALAREAAIAEVLGVISALPGDLKLVFDAILEKALALCEASFGGLLTFDGELYRLGAQRGFPPAFLETSGIDRAAFPAGPDTGLGRVSCGERVVHIADISDSEAYRTGDPVRVATVDLLGARSCVWVALAKDDVLFGTMFAFRKEVRPFSDKQIALLQNFAAQAVIAMDNARLLTETREAREQQTATAEVLSVINSSPGDLAPVFDAILEKAHHLCDARHGSMFLRDGEIFRAVALRGVPEALAERWRRGVPGSGTPAAQPLLEGARFVHIADIRELDHALTRAAAEAGVRTLLSVPLRTEVLIGMIIASRFEVRPFSDDQIALLQNFAAQAVIAVENARLITETREALEQQTATADVLRIISGSVSDVQPVFEAIVNRAIKLCDAEFAGVARFDDDGFLRLVATSNLSPEEAAAFHRLFPRPANRGFVMGRAFLERQPINVEDVLSDPEYDQRTQSDILTATGYRSFLGVPVLREGNAIGVIGCARRDVKAFTTAEIEVLRTFADQAVIAIENARLLAELRDRSDEIAGWNRELEARVAEQVEELGRVGRLKRFLAPQLAELIVSQGNERILESHRREIVVVFCDLRGYTAFTETAEPEEVLEFLREYHGALGPLVSQFEGTLDQFSGDGIMVFFNDPMPLP